MAEIADELVELREAVEPFLSWRCHIAATGSRALGDTEYPPCSGMPTMGQLRRLVNVVGALLPPPVDPDLIEARENAAIECEARGNSTGAALCRAGGWDAEPLVTSSLRALKRGRELATPAKD